MKFLFVAILVGFTLTASAILKRGPYLDVVPPMGSTVVTNESTNILRLVSLQITWTNHNTNVTGNVVIWDRRSSVSNKLFVIDFIGIESITWYPEGPVDMGKGDLWQFDNNVSNNAGYFKYTVESQ